MPVRLVALDEGSDIPLDRAMVVVGRHPQCDARLDSLRISRHHCCMTTDHGEVIVRDLGSTNGIRINGQRVEIGRLRAGDELSIAHIRYKLDNGQAHDATLIDNPTGPNREPGAAGGHGLRIGGLVGHFGNGAMAPGDANGLPEEQRVAAALRDAIPSALAERYRIQVIVVPQEGNGVPIMAAAAKVNGSAAVALPVEEINACRPDSCL